MERWRPLAAALAVTLPLMLVSSVRALAYNGGQAAIYADAYATSPNPNYPSFESSGDDCTNFVSQAMAYGGDQQVNFNYLPQDDWAWYMYRAGGIWNWTNSWSVAGDNWQFLYNTGRAYKLASYSGAYYTSNHSGAYAGDEIYYAWYYGDGDTSIHHMAIQVQDGFDEEASWTSLVDTHSNNRYHANWTLYIWNPYSNTTEIYVTHHV